MSPAVVIVHMSSGSDVPACIEHANELIRGANILGFVVSVSPVLDQQTCTICENEKDKQVCA
jgi:hypothetical protein